jgi:TusA-related sulfurtransferase
MPAPLPSLELDLRGTPCPLNYVRSKLALERLAAGEVLQVDLDAGEPEQMVVMGLRGDGHTVDVHSLETSGAVRLWIRRNDDS